MKLFKFHHKIDPETCPECQGNGFVSSIQGHLSDNQEQVEITNAGFSLCPKCRGACIIGVPQLKTIPMETLSKMIENKTTLEIKKMFVGKNSKEVDDLIASY